MDPKSYLQEKIVDEVEQVKPKLEMCPKDTDAPTFTLVTK